MASGNILGQDKINEARALNADMKRILDGPMFEEGNMLYQFVNNLVEWGDNTPIGNDIKDNLNKTITEYIRLSNHTKDLHKHIEEFLNTQEEINKGIF